MAAYYDISIEQGATYNQLFVWKTSEGDPVDITGFTARMQIRRRKTSVDAEHTATTENGGIELGGVDGTIRVIISAADTALFDFCGGVYDLELVTGGTVVTRLIEGAVTVSREVTR